MISEYKPWRIVAAQGGRSSHRGEGGRGAAVGRFHCELDRQVGEIFRGKVQKWNELPGSNGTGPVELYGQFCASTAGTIVQRKAMERRGFAPILQNLKNPPLRQKFAPVEVIGDLIGDANGIGFLMLGLDEELDRRVRIVPLAADDESPAALPTLESLAKGNYPLSDQQTIYLRDDSPRALREFCAFAVGPETAPVLSKQRLWPEHRIQQKLSEFRIAAVKRGEGAPVTVAGPASAENLVKDLALQYVAARETVQMRYRKVRSAEEGSRALDDAAAELTVVEGQIGEGEALASWPDTDQDSDDILLGRAALGVVVHPSLGLASLRMDELRAICAGEIGHWPAASGEGPRIRGYAVHASRDVMRIFQSLAESNGAGARKTASGGRKSPVLALASRSDSAQVVLSVARDPAGIGFVDLSELRPVDGSVVLVGLALSGDRVAQPAAGKAPADYPLVAPVSLRVAKNAGKAARETADWLKANPQADVLARHHLLPPVSEEPEVVTEVAAAGPPGEAESEQIAAVVPPPVSPLFEPQTPQYDEPAESADAGRGVAKTGGAAKAIGNNAKPADRFAGDGITKRQNAASASGVPLPKNAEDAAAVVAAQDEAGASRYGGWTEAQIRWLAAAVVVPGVLMAVLYWSARPRRKKRRFAGARHYR